jgi:hypothetical protein
MGSTALARAPKRRDGAAWRGAPCAKPPCAYTVQGSSGSAPQSCSEGTELRQADACWHDRCATAIVTPPLPCGSPRAAGNPADGRSCTASPSDRAAPSTSASRGTRGTTSLATAALPQPSWASAPMLAGGRSSVPRSTLELPPQRHGDRRQRQAGQHPAALQRHLSRERGEDRLPPAARPAHIHRPALGCPLRWMATTRSAVRAIAGPG